MRGLGLSLPDVLAVVLTPGLPAIRDHGRHARLVADPKARIRIGEHRHRQNGTQETLLNPVEGDVVGDEPRLTAQSHHPPPALGCRPDLQNTRITHGHLGVQHD